MPDKTITVRATRFDPERDREPRMQSYEVPFTDESMVVLDALNHVKSHIDGSLSYRWSCRMGICGSCGMMVNGTPKLTCNAFLRDYWPRPVVVQPLNNFPIIRDLVIDMDDFMHKLKSIKPWIIRKQELPLGAGEHRQSNEQIDDFRQFSECINCMLCYAACPVYGLNNEFLGPAGDRRQRRRLGVQLRRRVFGRLPQGCRPGQGDPADQARHDHALRPPVRQPRVTTEATAEATTEAPAAPREYSWRMPANWWTRNRHYFLYTVREFTALPLALWLLWLLVEIRRAGDGPARYAPHSSTAFVVFSVVVLAFALYHSYTFLTLAGTILHFKVLDRPVPAHLIVLSQFAAWAAASVVVAFVLIWFAHE